MHARAEDLLNLRELPELAPPPGVWERVLEAQRARASKRRFRRGLALAAAVAVAVASPVLYVATRDAPTLPTLVVVPEQVPEPRRARSYEPLMAESARLERLLAEMPAPRPLVVGAAAGTVVGLEDRIAVIDAQLSYAAARDLAPPYREALWGERVELMNALVVVRFAQMQGF